MSTGLKQTLNCMLSREWRERVRDSQKLCSGPGEVLISRASLGHMGQSLSLQGLSVLTGTHVVSVVLGGTKGLHVPGSLWLCVGFCLPILPSTPQPLPVSSPDVSSL